MFPCVEHFVHCIDRFNSDKNHNDSICWSIATRDIRRGRISYNSCLHKIIHSLNEWKVWSLPSAWSHRWNSLRVYLKSLFALNNRRVDILLEIAFLFPIYNRSLSNSYDSLQIQLWDSSLFDKLRSEWLSNGSSKQTLQKIIRLKLI